MTQEIISHSKEETLRIGREFAKHCTPGTVIALSGDLGAGKTTFTQGLLEGLGVEGPYTSPTFVLMKQYDVRHKRSEDEYAMNNTDRNRTAELSRIYHADAYRINTQQMLAIGWEEWIEDASGVVIIEWPERIADIIPETAINISLEWIDESSRKILVAL